MKALLLLISLFYIHVSEGKGILYNIPPLAHEIVDFKRWKNNT